MTDTYKEVQMRALLCLLTLAIAIACSFTAMAEEATLVTVKTYDDLTKLQVSREDPPLPDWLHMRADADPAIVGTVALPDGRWIVEIQRPIIAEDDLNDLWVSGFTADTEPKQLFDLFAQ